MYPNIKKLKQDGENLMQVQGAEFKEFTWNVIRTGGFVPFFFVLVTFRLFKVLESESNLGGW